jgi:hypothetical protein
MPKPNQQCPPVRRRTTVAAAACLAPERRLLLRSSSVRYCRSPSVSGTAPVRRLLLRWMNVRWARRVMAARSVPFRLAWLGSMPATTVLADVAQTTLPGAVRHHSNLLRRLGRLAAGASSTARPRSWPTPPRPPTLLACRRRRIHGVARAASKLAPSPASYHRASRAAPEPAATSATSHSAGAASTPRPALPPSRPPRPPTPLGRQPPPRPPVHRRRIPKEGPRSVSAAASRPAADPSQPLLNASPPPVQGERTESMWGFFFGRESEGDEIDGRKKSDGRN